VRDHFKKNGAHSAPYETMLDRINLIVFYGLAISVFCIVGGYLFSLIFPEVTIFGRISAIAVIPGWFSGASAVILFLIGSILFLFGRMENYWNSLYPLNLGLTFLGLCFIAYNPNQHPLIWIFSATMFALVVSLLLHRINIIKYKPFLLILTVLLFVYVVEWFYWCHHFRRSFFFKRSFKNDLALDQKLGMVGCSVRTIFEIHCWVTLR